MQGGIIHGTNKNNDLIGFITHNVWRYRGHHEITNAGQCPIIYAEGGETAVALASDTNALAANENSGELYYLPPKSQAEKALSAGNALPDRITDNQNVEVVARRSNFSFGDLVFHENNGISFYPKSNTRKYPPRPLDLEKYTLPYAEIGVSSFSDDAVLRITQFIGYEPFIPISFPIPFPLTRTLSFEADTITYTAGEKTFDLTQGSGGVEKEYVDMQDESYFEQSKEYTDSAVSTVAESVTQLSSSLTTTNNKVQTNTTDIAELREDMNELQSEYAYTTKIAFKTGGFALTFADKDGNEFVNNFSVTESGGKITKIANITAGKEIMVTYE